MKYVNVSLHSCHMTDHQTYVFFARYAWLLFVLFPVLFILPWRLPKATNTFYPRSPNSPWNSSSNPTWFVHMSDVHLSRKRKKSYPYISSVLNWSLGKFKPDRVVVAGDLTDNQGPEKFRPYRRQLQSDWDLYQKLLKSFNLTSTNLIQTMGNHDVYALKAYEETENFGKGFFPNRTSFHMSTVFYQHENTTYKFVVLNQYDFPTGPICLLQWSFITDEVKASLEKELRKDDCDVVIVVSHNPALRYHKLTTFANILKNSPKVRFMLSGHWHPMFGGILHFGDVVEIVSPPLFKVPRIGIVTFDNQRCGYNLLDKNWDVKAIMTHPISDFFASNYNLFNEEKTEIRALGFSEEPLNLGVYGDVVGRLRRVRKLKDGVYLYSLPMKLPPGKHILIKGGDWNGTVEFTIGEPVKPFREVPYMNRSSYGWTVLFVLMYIPALFLSIPLKWLPGIPGSSWSVVGVFVRSFAHARARIDELPETFKKLLWIETMLCVILPISFFRTRDLLCACHVIGNFFGHRYRYHYIGAKYGLTYLACMFYPVVNIVNGLPYAQPDVIMIFIDLLFLVYGIGKWMYDLMWLCDMFGMEYAGISPIMTLFPVSLYGSLLVHVITLWRNRNRPQAKNCPLYEQGTYYSVLNTNSAPDTVKQCSSTEGELQPVKKAMESPRK